MNAAWVYLSRLDWLIFHYFYLILHSYRVARAYRTLVFRGVHPGTAINWRKKTDRRLRNSIEQKNSILSDLFIFD